ncbi:MAG TPA: hypothetical protein VF525_12440 [Pyrinomonadaceae bacterium]
MSESRDVEALQELGRAATQIIHDLKNQLNGLKLYATFLRKRLEKTEGRADELETVNKLLAGLEHAAADMNALVRYGRPVELRRAPHVDLRRVLTAALAREPDATDCDQCTGEFDQAALKEALQQINTALAATKRDAAQPVVHLRQEAHEGTRSGVIEWRGGQLTDDDPFNSFAGSHGLHLALAAKLIRAHGGTIEHDAGAVRVRLPLASRDK